MPQFRKWFSNKIRGARNTKDRSRSSQPAHSHDPPVLPQIRACALTPSPSQERLVLAATEKDSFFQRLPWELRRQIQIGAFGGRTVHMDLEFDYPELPGDAHAGLQHESYIHRDRTAPLGWRWWSSVCHRNPGMEGWEDQCRAGNATCPLWPGEIPGKCLLGVMGWLLTCRQAYMEGLDVLYSTNTIHIGSPFLTHHLPLSILPQRLASITSLELLWELAFRSPLHPSVERKDRWPAYSALVTTVASAFPSLGKLYISIQTGSYVRDASAQQLESDEQQLLGPMDELVRKLGAQLQECQIAPPYSLYMKLESMAKGRGARIERSRPEVVGWQRFWQPVAVEHGEQPGDHLGYWVRQGRDDGPMYMDWV